MGLNNANADTLVFDIETAPLPDAADFIEPVEPPANYKDPEKIAAYVREKQAEQLERAALDVDLCQVVSIAVGYDIAPHRDDILVALQRDAGEAAMLQWFWDKVGDGAHLVGFNVIAFDLPVLVRRSQYLGVRVPDLVLDTYRHPRVTDLAQVLSYNGRLRLRKLSFYAKRFGLPATADPITGADIGAAFARGDWQAIITHVVSDVQTTAYLAQRLGVLPAPTFAGALARRERQSLTLLEPQVVS